MVAMMLEDMLEDLACRVVGVAPSIGKALAVIRGHDLDGVLLDMNIHGEKTVAIAEELARRAVPFLLVTGYGDGEDDPPIIRAAPRLEKPFTADELAQRMETVFAAAPNHRRKSAR